MALAHQTYEDDDVKASVTLDILTPYLTPPDGSKHRSVKAFVNTIPGQGISTSPSGTYDEYVSNQGNYLAESYSVIDYSNFQMVNAFAGQIPGVAGAYDASSLSPDLKLVPSGAVLGTECVHIRSPKSIDHVVICFTPGDSQQHAAHAHYYHAAHYYHGIAGHLGLAQRAVSNELAVSLDKIRKEVAGHRLKALSAAASAIRATSIYPMSPAETATWAIRELLKYPGNNRIDNAIDLLCSLGQDLINEIFLYGLAINPPDGNNDDFWYSVIRSLGLTGNRSLSGQFVKSGRIALQEAAVEALGDVGDTHAITELRTIARDASYPTMIRELANELATDLS